MPGKRIDPDKLRKGTTGHQGVSGNSWSRTAQIGAFLGLMALLFAPVILGPAGIICGIVAWAQGDEIGGPWAIALSSIGLVAGWWLGTIVWMAVQA